MVISNLYPTITPTLMLDFANSKVLDPRITFSRASGATYYDGETVAKAEQNLLLRSQEFNVSPWSTGNTGVTMTANADTAPDGTVTADFLNEGTAASQFHFTQQSIVKPALSQSYTFSFHVKVVGSRQVGVAMFDGSNQNGVGARFNLTNGTVAAQTAAFGTGFTALTATITALPNSWYRCSIGCITNTAASLVVQISLWNATLATNVYTGDGVSGAYLWGAQLEQRSSMTSYSVTTTQAVTIYQPQLLTAVNNQARFDHDPVSGESLGLLIEEQSSNTLLRSEEFNSATWNTKVNLNVDANVLIAPDGTQSADKIKEDTTNGEHYIEQNLTPAAGTYTISVFVKAAEYSIIEFRPVHLNEPSGGTSFIRFDLSTGPTATSNNLISNAYMLDQGNGWKRCVIVLTITSASTAFRFRLQLLNAGNRSYVGNGYNGMYVWGAQVETKSFATSYMKTEGSQATRLADSASMTGNSFSAWYRQDEGTTYVEAATLSNMTGTTLTYAISDNTFNQSFYGNFSAGNSYRGSNMINGGTAQTNSIATFTGINVTAGVKDVFTYKVNDIAETCNAATVRSITSGTIPAVDRLYLGSNWSGSGNFLNGFLAKFAFYPERLSNTQLQALTQ